MRMRHLPATYLPVRPLLSKQVRFGAAAAPQDVVIGDADSRARIAPIMAYMNARGLKEVLIRKHNILTTFHVKYHKNLNTNELFQVLAFEITYPGAPSSKHYINAQGQIKHNAQYYTPGSPALQELERYFQGFLTAIREGRTEPELPKSLGGKVEPEKKHDEPLSWRPNFIPFEHLSATNMDDLAYTLKALQILADTPPAKREPWQDRHLLPGMEPPTRIEIGREHAALFRKAAKTLDSSLCLLKHLNREQLQKLCQNIATQLASAKQPTALIEIRPALKTGLKDVEEWNKARYGADLDKAKDRIKDKPPK